MKVIKFKDLIGLYNFRYCLNDINDHNTKTIRIYPSFSESDELSDGIDYFEFGVNDWSGNTLKIAEEVLSEKVLNSYVFSITVNDETDVLDVSLTDDITLLED